MFLLQFLPDAFMAFMVNAILAIGVVSSLISFVFLNRFLLKIPAVAPYYRIMQVASAIFLILGIYLRGGLSVEMTWRERAREMEAKVAAAEAKSKEVNTVIEEKIVYRDRIVKERGKTQIQYIDRVVKEREEVKVFVEDCPIPAVIIDEHNKAAMPVRDTKAEGAK